jgi:hypothetical protein
MIQPPARSACRRQLRRQPQADPVATQGGIGMAGSACDVPCGRLRAPIRFGRGKRHLHRKVGRPATLRARTRRSAWRDAPGTAPIVGWPDPLAARRPGCPGGDPRLRARHLAMARALGARRSSAHPESSGQGEGHQRRPRHPATGHRRGRDPAWRLLTYRQLQTGREQLQIAQQGQVTERFTRAIDQLGHPELDVRLGGIYALERIANDSPNDRTTIAEVLTAFVRGHAPWPSRLPGQYRADAPIEQVPELPARAPDVQAALTVLARRQPLPKLRGRLDLEASDLRKARLEDANLQDASLAKANLQEAILDAADLQGAILYNVNLQGAVLADAKLQQASFDGAKLQGARLERAQLQGAQLVRPTPASTPCRRPAPRGGP